jgi:RimJ/RimL family protein N-acetyltransferase
MINRSRAARRRPQQTSGTPHVLDLAFSVLGLHRVIATMDARNHSSMRLAERLGMRREAHQLSAEMFKGGWSDLLVYAIVDDEWRARRQC